MSGIRHHVLPCFLLKGFCSRYEKENYFSWVYRKGSDPFETNIINIAVSKKFYSNQQINVDDDITELETELGEFVNDLRKTKKTEDLNSDSVPKLFTHFESRTKNLRDSFLEAGNMIMGEFHSQVNNHCILKKMVLDGFRKNTSKFLDAINREDVASVLPPDLKKNLALLIQNNADSFLDKMQPQLEMFAEIITKKMVSSFPKAVKAGHIKALKNNLLPKFKMTEYRKFKYTVHYLPEGNLILGDSGIVMQSESDKFYNSLFDSGETLKNIYLPISKKHILIGSKRYLQSDISERVIQSAIAECSREFFISSGKLDNALAGSLTINIGKRAKLIEEEKAKMIVKSKLDHFQTN